MLSQMMNNRNRDEPFGIFVARQDPQKFDVLASFL